MLSTSTSSWSSPGDEPAESISKAGVPVGQQLLKAGLLTQSQLAQALREQQQTHLKFGEVCLEHRWIAPQDLYQMMPSQSLSLGEILVSRGYLEFDQLRLALAQQRRYGRKLGEILIWKGWLKPEVLEEALREQRVLHQMSAIDAWQALSSQSELTYSVVNPPVAPPTSFGNTGFSDFAFQHSESAEPNSAASIIPPHLQRSPVVSTPQLVPTPTDFPSVPMTDSAISGIGSEKWVAQIMTYRGKIASLELQLETQQRDWDELTSQMNQQVLDFQEQYQQRVRSLGTKLKDQEQAHITALQTLAQQYQQRIQSLNQELQQVQAPALREQEQKITRLQADLVRQQSEFERARSSLNHRYQQQLQALESKIQQQQQQSQETLQVQSEVNQLRTQMQTLGVQLKKALPLAQKYQVLSKQVKPLLEALNGMKGQAQLLTQKLQKSQSDKAKSFALLIQQKSELGQAQSKTTQLTSELAAAKQQIVALNTQLQSRSQEVQLRQQVKQSYELLVSYRKSLETLQQDLKAQRDRNRLLEAQLARQTSIATAAQAELGAASSPLPLPPSPKLLQDLEIDEEPEAISNTASIPSAVLTPWARNLFFRLQEADLISDQQLQQVIAAWTQEGGKLTQVIADYTGLQKTTIRFFSDEGYAAQLYGCRHIGEFLVAAGLVSQDHLQSALQERTSGRRLGEILVAKGLIRSTTADYFARMFTQKGSSGLTR